MPPNAQVELQVTLGLLEVTVARRLGALESLFTVKWTSVVPPAVMVAGDQEDVRYGLSGIGGGGDAEQASRCNYCYYCSANGPRTSVRNHAHAPPRKLHDGP